MTVLPPACDAPDLVLVNYVPFSYPYSFPFNLAYLHAYLSQQGYTVRVLHPGFHQWTILQTVNALRELQPLVIGFSALFVHLPLAAEYISALKKEQGLSSLIVIGGQGVTPCIELALQVTGADLAVRGEGELILEKILEAKRQGASFHTIPGIAFPRAGNIVQTGPGPRIEDLAKFPPIDYDVFQLQQLHALQLSSADHYHHGGRRTLWVLGSRGCPHRCTFCYHSSPFRTRPIEEVVEETFSLVQRYYPTFIVYTDSLFLVDRSRTLAFLRLLKQREHRTSYSLSARFDCIADDEILEALRDTHCRVLRLGMESGSQRILDAMQKDITVAMIDRGLEKVQHYGIIPSVTMQIGQPQETFDDIRQTIELAERHAEGNGLFRFFLTTPYPGTTLYAYAKKRGLIRSDREFYEIMVNTGDGDEGILNLTSIPFEKLRIVVRLANEYFDEKRRCNAGTLSNALVSLDTFLARQAWPLLNPETNSGMLPVRTTISRGLSFLARYTWRKSGSMHNRTTKTLREALFRELEE
ncbi:MAG: hypothetical protein A2284_11165 [Deltaproteobacteria bacterium RIFOXYA12_FULL_61_11]|nr:MAG: hypothetical protein A2284_11165 [Deltaproteobacteria bacterium RIFOXYA12_FULL_61_11]